jgi:hypothetical protein
MRSLVSIPNTAIMFECCSLTISRVNRPHRQSDTRYHGWLDDRLVSTTSFYLGQGLT